MKVFYTVAKHQNISSAAKELDVTQPAVSRIISNMEKEYNTTLFFRSKNGVILTREGNKLYESIKIPFQQLEKVEADINLNSLSETTVHIGATATSLECFLFKVLDEIKKKYTSITIRIYTDSSSNLLNKLEEGIIDFAFITTPYKVSQDIEIKDVYELHNILLAPISYKSKINGPISIKKLVNYPFIFLNVAIKSLEKYPFVLLNKEMQFREHIESFLNKYGLNIKPVYEIDSSSMLIPLVENDCGLTFIPEEIAKLFMLWLLLRKNSYFDEHLDGIVYAVCISLDFAGIENVSYMLSDMDNLSE